MQISTIEQNTEREYSPFMKNLLEKCRINQKQKFLIGQQQIIREYESRLEKATNKQEIKTCKNMLKIANLTEEEFISKMRKAQDELLQLIRTYENDIKEIEYHSDYEGAGIRYIYCISSEEERAKEIQKNIDNDNTIWNWEMLELATEHFKARIRNDHKTMFLIIYRLEECLHTLAADNMYDGRYFAIHCRYSYA